MFINLLNLPSKFGYALPLIAIVLSTYSSLQAVGIYDSKELFSKNIRSASEAIQPILRDLQYTHPRPLALQTLKLNSHTDSPVHMLRYGWITQKTISSFWKVAGSDNRGMLGIEMTFKDYGVGTRVHTSLAGKTILFLAYSGRSDQLYIKLSSKLRTTDAHISGGLSSLEDKETMRSILGWTCHLKSKRCADNAQLQQSASGVTCSNNDLQDIYTSGSRFTNPGYYQTNFAGKVNLFSHLYSLDYGIFLSCKSANALQNTLLA